MAAYATYKWWKNTFNTAPPDQVQIKPTPEELFLLKLYNCIDANGDWNPVEM
jgi:hypothetical protein